MGITYPKPLDPSVSKQAGGTIMTTEIQPRIGLTNVIGDQKRGKSHLGLTGPGPIGVIAISSELRQIVGPFVEQGKIIHQYPIRKGLPLGPLNQVNSRIVIERFCEKYYWAINKVRTLLVDSGTDFHDIARMGLFGKLDKVPQYLYGELNTLFENLTEAAKSPENLITNVIWTHKLKDDWVKGQNTGLRTEDGWQHMRYAADLTLLAERDTRKQPYGPFRMQIADNRFPYNPEAAGQWFEGDQCEFPVIAATVLPGVDPLAFVIEDLNDLEG